MVLCVCCIAGLIGSCEECGLFKLLYVFIFEVVYLGDGSRLAVMLPDFLLTWRFL